MGALAIWQHNELAYIVYKFGEIWFSNSGVHLGYLCKAGVDQQC